MEQNEISNINSINKTLKPIFDLHSRNKHRYKNMIIDENEYFELIYNMDSSNIELKKKDTLIYSTTPYDVGRIDIQTMAIRYLLNPNSVESFVNIYEDVIKDYIQYAMESTNLKKINSEYANIHNNYLYMIQIAGRILQHTSRGPLSASLDQKFIFDNVKNNGILGYIHCYIQFILNSIHRLPISTNGRFITLSFQKNIGLSKLNNPNKQNTLLLLENENEKPIILTTHDDKNYRKESRNNYKAHSIHPLKLKQYFTNPLPIENDNIINIISDIHSITGKLPFINNNYNILVGDVFDKIMGNSDLKGIFIIGNHDLWWSSASSSANKKEYTNTQWWKELHAKSKKAWPLLPESTHPYYDDVKSDYEKRFPNMTVLHNDSIVLSYDGYKRLRIIGITLPVASNKNKVRDQKIIENIIRTTIKKDKYQYPTIIVSHAPLFNELTLLSKKSPSYKKNRNCLNNNIEKLFNDANIIGVIHGHHHIPITQKTMEIRQFGCNQLILLTSIYSQMNTGIDLLPIIKSKEDNDNNSFYIGDNPDININQTYIG